MISPLIDLRRAMAALIEKARGDLLFQDFILDQGSIPARKRLDELKDQPRIALLGLGWGDVRRTRALTSEIDLTIQVTIQKKLERRDDGSEDQNMADGLVMFFEQIADVVKPATAQEFIWVRHDPLRDATGTPYSFETFREEALFQGIFNAVYRGPWVPFNRSRGA